MGSGVPVSHRDRVGRKRNEFGDRGGVGTEREKEREQAFVYTQKYDDELEDSIGPSSGDERESSKPTSPGQP